MTLFVSRLVSIATPIMLCACAAAHAAGITYPESPKKPVTDTYHGVSVSEDYRWLEENDATVKAWNAAQLRLARSQLDAVPGRAVLKARLKDLYGNAPVKHYDFVQRGALFAMKRQPPKNQPFLVMMKSPNDVNNARVIVDPNKLNAKGTTAIDFYAPSIDGKYVAVSLSENGSEDGSVYVFETATGKKLKDVIPRVQYPTGGGSVAWNESGSGFFYTRYPQGSERASEDVNFYQQVYFHALGLWRYRPGDHDIGWDRNGGPETLTSQTPGFGNQALLIQRLADRVAGGSDKRIRDTTTDNQLIYLAREGFQDRELGGDFGATDDGDHWPCGLAEDFFECFEFRHQQRPGAGNGRIFRYTVGARLGPMGGSERVHDKNIAQPGHLAGERWRVLLLAGIEAHVFAEDDFPIGNLEPLQPFAHERHRLTEQLLQPPGHRAQRKFGIEYPLYRAPQMGKEDYGGATV